MSVLKPAQNRPDIQANLDLRPPHVVMNLARLGSLHPYRLSFMRILLRRLAREEWQIENTKFDLDPNGYGTVIYQIKAPLKTFNFVIFSHKLEDENRSDRVIAEQWDITATLIAGDLDDQALDKLRRNVPLQEKGRLNSNSIVLTRANKSSRNFEAVVAALANGKQPSASMLSRVGYLYRTTAVYGSGKFGMADWAKMISTYKDFAQPFAAEMLACYLIRHFSLQQVEFIARQRNNAAVTLTPTIKRYLGIGNATGLGMAPFLVKHPLIVERWIAIREIALARATKFNTPDAVSTTTLMKHMVKAIRHIEEITTDNNEQQLANQTCVAELNAALDFVQTQECKSWQEIIEHAGVFWSYETQEVINSLIIELYPEQTDDLEQHLCVDETYTINPNQPLSELSSSIEQHYQWALDIDTLSPEAAAVFWYRSEEKMEPRLGNTTSDPGSDMQMDMAIGIDVKECHFQVNDFLSTHPTAHVAAFVLMHPQFRGTVQRIQTMASTFYGDIRANLHQADVKPTHLMRCKLSFFGVSKFDPRSRLWVRNTMYQGAPLVEDLIQPSTDNWYFPVMPTVT